MDGFGEVFGETGSLAGFDVGFPAVAA